MLIPRWRILYYNTRASHQTPVCWCPGGGCDEKWPEKIVLSAPDKSVGGGVQQLQPPVQHQTEPSSPVRPGGCEQQVEKVEHQHHHRSSQSRQSSEQPGGGLGQAQQDQVGGDRRPGGQRNTGREGCPERPHYREQSQSELGGLEIGKYPILVHSYWNIS